MRKDGHQPILIVIAGPNGSGKTTITTEVLESKWLEDAVYVNPDNIAQKRFGDWNSPDAVRQAAIYCQEWREECLRSRQSLIFETVMSAPDKIDFISTTNPEINAARIAKRVMKGGHDVPIPKIISRYVKSIANCAEIAREVDRLYVYDNSEENTNAKPLFRFRDGRLGKLYTDKIPEWAENILQG